MALVELKHTGNEATEFSREDLTELKSLGDGLREELLALLESPLTVQEIVNSEFQPHPFAAAVKNPPLVTSSSIAAD